MEAVPKLAMLEYELKQSPDNSDLIQKLKALIHVSFFMYCMYSLYVLHI